MAPYFRVETEALSLIDTFCVRLSGEDGRVSLGRSHMIGTFEKSYLECCSAMHEF